MEQTSLNIGTIGQKLESARQSKGLSVSEAGRATKILSKFIEAMESDDFGALSAPVYAKSFIRMYAKYLGLDAQPLVDEYTAQHIPKAKRPLTDEVRQNLAKGDQATVESPPPTAGNGTKRIFGDVNESIDKLSGANFSPKIIAIGGSVLVVLVILLSVTQCDSEDEDTPVPAPSGAASLDRQLLFESPPDAYLVKPGKIKVDQK